MVERGGSVPLPDIECRTSLRSTTAPRLDAAVYAALALAAVLLWWLTRTHALLLPFWAPWEFSFVEFLSGWVGA